MFVFFHCPQVASPCTRWSSQDDFLVPRSTNLITRPIKTGPHVIPFFSSQPFPAFSIANDERRSGKEHLCEIPFDVTHSFVFDPQTLLVDGYISQTFRSRAAEQYFLNLLKRNSVPSLATFSYSEWEGYLFFVHSVPPHIPPPLSSPPGFWLLDRGIVDRGTVVPQRMWSPHSAPDRDRKSTV